MSQTIPLNFCHKTDELSLRMCSLTQCGKYRSLHFVDDIVIALIKIVLCIKEQTSLSKTVRFSPSTLPQEYNHATTTPNIFLFYTRNIFSLLKSIWWRWKNVRHSSEGEKCILTYDTQPPRERKKIVVNNHDFCQNMPNINFEKKRKKQTLKFHSDIK